MKNTQKNQYGPPLNILLLGDDFLRIFLPMVDDEERRRLEELEEEDPWDLKEDDWSGEKEELDD